MRAKILFSGGGKLIYEFSYRSDAHPACNKAKVEVPFSSISAMSFDQATSTFTVTLSAPPVTFVGSQAVKARLQKDRTVFQPQQVHLSPDRTVKATKMHTVTLANARQAATFKSKLSMVGRLAALLAAAPQQADASAVFSAGEVEASMGGRKRASGGGEASAPKRRAPPKPRAPNNTTLEAGWSTQLPAGAGPWMSKSIKRWKLQAPYQTTCDEAAWEKYHKERATLDFLTNAVSAGWLDCRTDPHGHKVPIAPAPEGGPSGTSAQPDLQDALSVGAGKDQQAGAAVAAGSSATAQGPASTGTSDDEDADDGAPDVAKDQPAGAQQAVKAAAKLSRQQALVEGLRWREEWAPPSGLKAFCLEYYGEGWGANDDGEGGELRDAVEAMRNKVAATLAKCSGVQGVAELAATAGSSVYILGYHVNWEDGGDPRTIDVNARMYSPCASPAAIDLHYNAHKHYRSLFAECCCEASIFCRLPETANPEAPQARRGAVGSTELFSADLQDSGYAKRSILGPQALKDVQGHVFGRKGLVSERKMFNMLAAAAGAGRFNDKLASSQFGVYRVIRRKHKRFVGETSDAESGADRDSGNEKLKKARSQYPPPDRGFGFGGFYDDDDDGGSEELNDGAPCHMM